MIRDSALAVDACLFDLSQCIRGFRAARGMARKDLAHHTGISERYLAQLESGHANPSVAVLWRVAEAMDVDLAGLLSKSRKASLTNTSLWRLLQRLSAAEQQRAYAMLKREFDHFDTPFKPGVALIGLRGAGKTTLGRQAAQARDRPYVRLSERIARIAGMPISEIFALAGQKTYRRLERQALDEVIAQQPEAMVEAGGSIVSQPGTFALLLTSYFTVWVRARPEEHMQRVQGQGDTRPMQGHHAAMADLKRILAEREAEYARADYVLDTSARSIESCLSELVALVSDPRGRRKAAV